MKSKRLLTPLLTTVLTLGINTAMATDMMVLKSKPSNLFTKGDLLTLKEGHIYHGQEKLTLLENQNVKVLLCDGTTVLLTGMKPKIPNIPTFTCHFDSLIDDLDTTIVPKPDGNDDERGHGTSTPNLWMVDVTTSATYCVRAGRIALWRSEENHDESQLVLTHQTKPLQSVTVTWPANQAILIWPAKISVKDSDSYTAQLSESVGL